MKRDVHRELANEQEVRRLRRKLAKTEARAQRIEEAAREVREHHPCAYDWSDPPQKVCSICRLLDTALEGDQGSGVPIVTPSLDEAVERVLKNQFGEQWDVAAEEAVRQDLLAAGWEEREAEIERYGAEVERLHGEYEKRLDELYAAEAEVERLRQVKTITQHEPVDVAEVVNRHRAAERERDFLRAENERLQQLPCPYIASSVEGTFYCKLAEATKNSPTGADSDLCDKLASAAKDHSHHGRRNAECGLCAALSEYHDQRGTG